MKVALVLTQDRAGPVDLTVALALEVAGRRAGPEVVIVGPEPVTSAGDASTLLRPVSVRSKGDLSGAIQLRRTLAEIAPDVVHAQDRRAGLMAVSIARGAAATLGTYHGIPDAMVTPELPTGRDAASARPGPRAAAVLAADAALLRLLPMTVAPSRFVADFLRRRLHAPPDRVRVLLNGVAQPPAALSRGPARVFTSVNAFAPRKAMTRLVEAFATVAHRRPEARLRLIGDGEERPACQRLVSERGLDSRVEFLGYRSDVPAQLAQADAFVLPSLAENMPLALLEAMGAGLACVATRVGGVPEALGNGAGLLVPPGDTPALAHAMSRLAEEPGLSESLGATARARARESFSIVRCADEHMALWSELSRAARQR